MRLTSVVAALALFLVPSAGATGQTPPAAAASPFTVEEVMVPMRDGARLQTVIFRPRAARTPLPILLQRTPYGVSGVVPDRWAALVRDGYIFVSQSMRGRFKSDGDFTFSTAVHPGDPKATDESTDAYDTIDWLVRHVPGNSGKVGMRGISYPGFAAGVALVRPHPALKAVSPQATWTDYWLADDLHRGGALRLSYATDWTYMLQHDRHANAALGYDRYDVFDWFLRAGTAEGVDRLAFGGTIPMFTALLDHPDHDAFYTRQRWTDALGRTRVPTLNVAGYWDQEDPSGSWAIYRKQEADDPDRLNVMVAGPWSHGAWGDPATSALGRIPYGVASGRQFLEDVEAPFFAWWLHGRGAKPAYEVRSFQSGSWTWRSYAHWPPATARATDLYLRADGTLSFAAPAAGEGCRAYRSDPASPVPYRPRPMGPTYPSADWRWWEAEDQRFVDGRPDVLDWTSAPLTADLAVTGTVAAELMAATSGTDADFVVKLIDVYPDDHEPVPDALPIGGYARSLNGYQLPVAMEVRRGRYLTSDTRPQPLVPGRVTRWDVPLRDHDHVFRAGHRIMVQVQSTWFPVIDRNPQTFVPNIARARPEDFVAATQQVCAGSRIVLPVVKG